jgi:hypothetical protein
MAQINLTEDPIDLLLNTFHSLIVNRQIYTSMINEGNYNVGNNEVFACLDYGIDNLMNRLNNENIINTMNARQRTLWNYLNRIININL